MDYFHHGTGIIKYNPHRPGMKNRTQGWCVANVDREISRYYRHWLEIEKHIHLTPPSWEGHCSIVRGELLRDDVKHLWKKYHNQHIDLTYEHGVYHSAPDKKNGGEYYWITVSCPMFGEMRKELKLPVGWQFHITIGRTHEYDARKPKR